MRDALIRATQAAIRQVDHLRFFATERGFHGRFYCALQTQLDQEGILTDGRILEMEYQKSGRHGLTQRPDIVLHVPAEAGRSVRDNNFAVWALKFRADEGDARDDFRKLNEMFEHLRYPCGFFINIDSTDPKFRHYTGAFPDRVLALAVRRGLDGVEVSWQVPAEHRE